MLLSGLTELIKPEEKQSPTMSLQQRHNTKRFFWEKQREKETRKLPEPKGQIQFQFST
jgi:hypothetical protein